MTFYINGVSKMRIFVMMIFLLYYTDYILHDVTQFNAWSFVAFPEGISPETSTLPLYTSSSS